MTTRPFHWILLFAGALCLAVPGWVFGHPADPSTDPLDLAASIAQRHYDSRRIDGSPPTVDGRLDDPVWQTVEWSGGFIQRDPAEGEAPSLDTLFKVVFDDQALYFAFRLHDEPDLISRELARRDSFPGDWIEVNIDSYFDHRTAFSFTLSCSGVRGDELVSEDGNRWDSNWDAIWDGATQIDDQGWTAEMRIPLGQLRFSDAEEQVWGLQVTRRIFRLEERSSWQRIPKDVAGFVSRFGELRGLSGLEPKRRVELTPYLVLGAERFEAEEGNPFLDGSESNFEGGLDGKVGLTPNLTVDFTLNPDFGQVEADPSEVNLTVFETFFPERRPFFIEGQDIFELRLAPAVTGGPFTGDRLFYSRRIGRRPTLSADVPDGGFSDAPQNSTILGAFKLSGKTANGLSVGFLGSVTDEEEALIDVDGVGSRQVVEPMTGYFVGRLRQDYRGGDTQIGGMVTAVDRQLDDDPRLETLREQAFAGGVDLSHYFHNRDYRFQAQLFASQLRGSAESITLAQESSARYYQRPDNDHVTFDPTRTSLSGHSGSLRLSRTRNHKLVFQTGVAWRSPGFEVNDVGFMRAADGIDQFTWIGFQERNPFGIFNRLNINFNQRTEWDYGRNYLGAVFNTNANTEFKNRINAGIGITRRTENISNTRLRGGPSSRWPGHWAINAWVNTDRRKNLFARMGFFALDGDAGNEHIRDVWASLTWRPSDALRLTLEPSHVRSVKELQYITTQDFDGSPRYLFGTLDRETTVLTVRMDYSITPDLSVQLYASPFVSTGRYREIKRITDPRAREHRQRFDVFDTTQIASDGAGGFEIDENNDGRLDYTLSDPNFDFRELNSNLVVRWEYSPGSAVFLVWSQVRDDSTLERADLGFGNQLDQLFSTPAHDVFLLKVSQWVSEWPRLGSWGR